MDDILMMTSFKRTNLVLLSNAEGCLTSLIGIEPG